MEEAPPSDGTFQLVPSATPGVWDFKVAIHYGAPRPDSAIAAGTAYSAVTSEQMGCRPHLGEGWDAYVAAQSEPAGTRVMWQYFTASLPTTPRVTERLDPVWGKVHDHSYLDLITNTKPDRAEIFAADEESVTDSTGATVTVGGSVTAVTMSDGRMILNVAENDRGQGLCEVVVTTVDAATVTTTDEVFDQESGTLLPVTTTRTLAAAAPDSSALDALGFFTEVTNAEHRLWLSVRRKASGLPSSRATAITWATMESIYWPEVLENYRFDFVLDDGLQWWDKLLSASVREAYTQPVLTRKRRWFQATPPADPVPAEMVPSSISVRGQLQTVALGSCLHGEFVYEEPNYVADLNTSVLDPVPRMCVWTFGATGMTDWPVSVIRLEVAFRNGGYDCTESEYLRPTDYNHATLTTSRRDIVAADGVTHRYSIVTLTPGTDLVI